MSKVSGLVLLILVGAVALVSIILFHRDRFQVINCEKLENSADKDLWRCLIFDKNLGVVYSNPLAMNPVDQWTDKAGARKWYPIAEF